MCDHSRVPARLSGALKERFGRHCNRKFRIGQLRTV
jgi:hypothetical protein